MEPKVFFFFFRQGMFDWTNILSVGPCWTNFPCELPWFPKHGSRIWASLERLCWLWKSPQKNSLSKVVAGRLNPWMGQNHCKIPIEQHHLGKNRAPRPSYLNEQVLCSISSHHFFRKLKNPMHCNGKHIASLFCGGKVAIRQYIDPSFSKNVPIPTRTFGAALKLSLKQKETVRCNYIAYSKWHSHVQPVLVGVAWGCYQQINVVQHKAAWQNANTELWCIVPIQIIDIMSMDRFRRKS